MSDVESPRLSAARMSEAEVAIRFAERFLTFPGAAAQAMVAIDGAVVEVTDKARFFEIESFLAGNGWKLVRQDGKRPWHGVYARRRQELRISSKSGAADVVLQLGDRRVVAECKGGPLVKKPGSPERRILTEALGQALIWNALPKDLIIAAVPDTPAFRSLVGSWQQRPLVRNAGIQLALVARDGAVSGCEIMN